MKTLFDFYNLIFSKINSIRYYLKEKSLYFIVKKKFFQILKKKNPLISVILPTYNRCKIFLKMDCHQY